MELYDYQKYAVKQVINRPKLALWLDMGLGKTTICLHAVCELIKDGTIRNVLVIAPKLVCSVWQDEAAKWNLPLKVNLLTGTEKARSNALHDDTAQVYVISRDSLGWLFQQDFQCDMLIVDESTSIKNPSTLRYSSLCHKTITLRGKKMFRKKRIIDMFSRVLLLSGTPASEGTYVGLWAQISLLCRGDEHPLGRSITVFKEAYMMPSYYNTPYPVYDKMKPGAIDIINKKLEPFCISMKSEDYLQLPERIDIVRYTGMTDKRYKKLEKTGVLTVDGTEILAGGVQLWMKLQQVSSGFIYDEKNVAHTLNHSKEEALQELLECIDEPVLILYRYEYEKQYLMSIGGVCLETDEAVKRFQEGKTKIGLIYPASGGKGLTLTSTSYVIWYSLPLSYEDYIQSIKRVHRQSQTKPVKVVHLISKGTIDEHIFEILQKKKEVLRNLMLYYKCREELMCEG